MPFLIRYVGSHGYDEIMYTRSSVLTYFDSFPVSAYYTYTKKMRPFTNYEPNAESRIALF